MSTLVLLFFLHAMGIACDCRNTEAYLVKPAAGGCTLACVALLGFLLRFCAWHIHTCGSHAESCDPRERKKADVPYYDVVTAIPRQAGLVRIAPYESAESSEHEVIDIRVLRRLVISIPIS